MDSSKKNEKITEINLEEIPPLLGMRKYFIFIQRFVSSIGNIEKAK